MEIKFWKIIVVAIITFTVSKSIVNAATTYRGQYMNNNTWYDIPSNGNIPNTSNEIRIDYTDSNIKNYKNVLTAQIQMTALGKWNENNIPIPIVRYGTANNYSNITSNCNIYRWATYDQNDQIIMYTYANYVITCDYKGNNSNANWYQVRFNNIEIPFTKIYYKTGLNINVDGMNEEDLLITQAAAIMSNSGSLAETIMMQFAVNAATQAAAIAAQNIQVRSDISNSTQTTANNIEAAKQAILNAMGVSGTNFTYDTTSAETLESAEGQLKGRMIDPNSLGINNYININPQETSYQAGLTMMWEFISNLIGPLSAVWIITSILLTLGSIKLILSR